MTPDLAFQTAVRAALVNAPDVTMHVTPERIRSGSIRPETMPAIVLGYPRTSIEGRASGGQIVARLDMMLHIWTEEAQAEIAQRIGAGVLRTLIDAPATVGFTIDSWDRPALAWVRDPHPETSHVHGAVSLSAVIRWRE